MSDQGDAGQWRPANRQNEHSAPDDDVTGPIPVVPQDEAEQGFPPPSGLSDPWSSADEEPAGGFPSVPAEPSNGYSSRAPFEPADPSPASPEPEAQDDDVWKPKDKPADDEPAEPAPTYGMDAYDTRPFEQEPAEEKSSFVYEAPADDTPSYEFPEEPRPEESSFYALPPQERRRSSGEATFGYADDAYGAPRGPDAMSAEAPPAPRGPEAPEDNDEEFFAQDGHPPMWDKVVAPTGPPPKPGKPSSGNIRLPDWMRDENNAQGTGGPPPGPSDGYDEDGGSRKGLYAGLSLLVAGLLAVGAVYVMRGGGDSKDASHTASPGRSSTKAPKTPASQPPVDLGQQKPLGRFKGVHTTTVSRITDTKAGLSYPRFGRPWALAPKTSPMSELGFNLSQFAVTEKAAGHPKRWARLMSAPLGGAEKSAWSGPGSERQAATLAASSYEARMYGFRHRKKLLASQPLDIAGHKGWLAAYYLTYQRPGTKATGDVVAVAVVNTGKAEPGVLFMSVPNTDRKLWPDVNYVVRQLRVM